MFKRLNEIRRENQEFRDEFKKLKEDNGHLKKYLEEMRLNMEYLESKLYLYEKREKNNIVLK